MSTHEISIIIIIIGMNEINELSQEQTKLVHRITNIG